MTIFSPWARISRIRCKVTGLLILISNDVARGFMASDARANADAADWPIFGLEGKISLRHASTPNARISSPQQAKTHYLMISAPPLAQPTLPMMQLAASYFSVTNM